MSALPSFMSERALACVRWVNAEGVNHKSVRQLYTYDGGLIADHLMEKFGWFERHIYCRYKKTTTIIRVPKLDSCGLDRVLENLVEIDCALLFGDEDSAFIKFGPLIITKKQLANGVAFARIFSYLGCTGRGKKYDTFRGLQAVTRMLSVYDDFVKTSRWLMLPDERDHLTLFSDSQGISSYFSEILATIDLNHLFLTCYGYCAEWKEGNATHPSDFALACCSHHSYGDMCNELHGRYSTMLHDHPILVEKKIMFDDQAISFRGIVADFYIDHWPDHFDNRFSENPLSVYMWNEFFMFDHFYPVEDWADWIPREERNDLHLMGMFGAVNDEEMVQYVMDVRGQGHNPSLWTANDSVAD